MQNCMVLSVELIIQTQEHYDISDYVTFLRTKLNDLCQTEYWIPLISQALIFVLNALKVNRPKTRN